MTDPIATPAAAIPTVKRPRQGLPTAVIAGAAVLLGVLLFAMLESRRSAATRGEFEPTQSAALIASPAELLLPGDYAAPAGASIAYGDNQGAPARVFYPGGAQFLDQPPRGPAPVPYSPPQQPAAPVEPYVQSFGDPTSDGAPPTMPIAAPVSPVATGLSRVPALVLDRGVRRSAYLPSRSLTGEEAIAAAADPAYPLRPQQKRVGPYLLPSGTMIPAVLETPLDSSRGGPARALVTADTRGYDGREVLIPKGARLIGEYEGGGQGTGKHLLVAWKRLVLPDGRQVIMDFPATDKRGAPGVKGKVHGDFLRRFGSALLQTALSIATFKAIDTDNSNNGGVLIGLPGMAMPMLVQPGESRRRITVPAGTKVNVFVARDIDFAPEAEQNEMQL